VVPWRRRRLQRAGFDVPLAERLARDRRFDLHAMLELVESGCPPHLAARILAPLEDPAEDAADARAGAGEADRGGEGTR
jgi:hypothetical protein